MIFNAVNFSYTETDRHADKQTDTQTDTQTERQTDTQTDKQTDTQTDKQTGRQTDTQTDPPGVPSIYRHNPTRRIIVTALHTRRISMYQSPVA